MVERRLVAWLLCGLAALSGGGCSDDPTRIPAADGAPSAAATRNSVGPKWIPGQYIVQFKDDVRDVPGLVKAMVTAPGDSVLFVYEHAIKGFAARLAPPAVEALQRNPHVERVTQDEWGTPDQSGLSWGLDRIDQRNRPLNGSFAPNRTGAGVSIYILDSGIRRTHREFGWGARARHAYSAIADGRGGDDCHGHGTHVAGTAGGTNYGVARQSTLLAVRIAGCNNVAAASSALAGMDWLRAYRVLPAVANLSFSWSSRSDIDNAAQALINAGVTFVTSAGNDNANACSFSPKGVSEAIVVAGTDWNDYRVPSSNWGSCVDVFAPGQDILSAWAGSDTDEWTDTGTSFASPHVAGVAALYLEGDPGAAPWKVRNAVYNSATTNVVGGANGAANRLLYAFPTYLAVSLSGPDSYASSGYHTWEAFPEGGNGSYAYQWVLHYSSNGSEYPLGTGKSQTVYLNGSDGSFVITVSVTSASATTSTSKYVAWVGSGGSCGGNTAC